MNPNEKRCYMCISFGSELSKSPCKGCISRRNWRPAESFVTASAVRENQRCIGCERVRDFQCDVDRLNTLNRHRDAFAVKQAEEIESLKDDLIEAQDLDIKNTIRITELEEGLCDGCEVGDDASYQAKKVKDLKDTLEGCRASNDFLRSDKGVWKTKAEDLQRQLNDQKFTYQSIGDSPGRCEGCTHVEVLEEEKKKLQERNDNQFRRLEDVRRVMGW